ncbi:MAG: tetratricopeptide repeat protein [Syntrophobacteraceae bacterium]
MYIISWSPRVCAISPLSKKGRQNPPISKRVAGGIFVWSLPTRASGAGVRKIFVGFAVLASIALGVFGCASNNSPATGQSDHSKQLEQQKRIPQELVSPKKLPEMTDEDYERLGDSFVQQGNLEKGFIQYDKLLQKKPGNSRLLYKRGMVFLVKDRSIEALGDFQEALKKEPGNALLHQGAGEALYKLKRADEAEKEFQLALKSDGKLWLSHNFLGIIYDYKQRPDLAVEQYQAAISLRPEWGAVYNNLGVSWSLQGKWEKAVAAFEDAIKKGYSDPQVGNNLGLALCQLGRDIEAIEAFKRSGDEAQAYNNLGSFHLQQGDYEEAVHAFERAIQLRSTFYAQASENLKKAQAALHSQAASGPAGSTKAPKKEPDDDPTVSQPLP